MAKRQLTEGERELIEDALKASAFKYRHAFVNAACRVSQRLNADDAEGLAKLTETEFELLAKAKAFEVLATMMRRYPVSVDCRVEIPDQA